MKAKRPTFEKTLSLLVTAFMNGTLEAGNYCACAVGNMIAKEVGAKIVVKDGYTGTGESKYIWSHSRFIGDEWYQTKYPDATDSQKKLGCELIDKTGYTFEEIWSIEKSFEKHFYTTKDPEERMFKGLMSCVDVLADIHGINLEAKEEAKKLFVKA